MYLTQKKVFVDYLLNRLSEIRSTTSNKRRISNIMPSIYI